MSDTSQEDRSSSLSLDVQNDDTSQTRTSEKEIKQIGDGDSNDFDERSRDDLNTPLLARSELEFESQGNLNALVSECEVQGNLPFWDRFKTSLSNKWLESSDGNKSRESPKTGNNRVLNHIQNECTNDTGTKYTSIAAVFLRDYESSRPCSLSPNIETITSLQLEMYNQRFSTSHQFLLYAAMTTLFLASFFEGQKYHGLLAITLQMTFTAFAALIFTMDIFIRGHYDDDNLFNANIQTLYTRKTRARKWKIPMLLILVAITLESSIKILFVDETQIVWCSIFKPIVFFYVSSKARDGKSFVIFIIILCLRVLTSTIKYSALCVGKSDQNSFEGDHHRTVFDLIICSYGMSSIF